LNENEPLPEAPAVFPSASLPESEPARPTLRRLFFGDDGLRAGWSFLLFILMVAFLILLVNLTIRHFHLIPKTPKRAPGEPADPISFRVNFTVEMLSFLAFFVPALIMSFIEKRPFRRYGFNSARFLPDLLMGIFWGLMALSGLVATLFFTHHLAFDDRLLHGTPMLLAGAKWLAFFCFVGLAEEFQTRGYIQYTVSRGVAGIARAMDPNFRHSHAVGFWVSAFLFSILLFMAGHLANPGETLTGILAVGGAGAVFAFSLYRTGSLWWAIGFHTAWDWAQSFLYGVPDSGMMVKEHLFATHPLANPLYSGGTTGPEGSVFVLPAFLFIALIIHFTLPRRSYPLTPDQSPPPPKPPSWTLADHQLTASGEHGQSMPNI
jgi:membrane protease YdiL (CAAX protease family)